MQVHFAHIQYQLSSVTNSFRMSHLLTVIEKASISRAQMISSIEEKFSKLDPKIGDIERSLTYIGVGKTIQIHVERLQALVKLPGNVSYDNVKLSGRI